MHIVSASPQYLIGGAPFSQNKFMVSRIDGVVVMLTRESLMIVSVQALVVSWLGSDSKQDIERLLIKEYPVPWIILLSTTCRKI